jgi:transposase-like protein
VNISAVARRHGIKPSLLFRWRRLARGGEDRQSTSAFIPVTLALPAPEAPVLEAAAEVDASPTSSPPAASREFDTQRIEIVPGRHDQEPGQPRPHPADRVARHGASGRRERRTRGNTAARTAGACCAEQGFSRLYRPFFFA